MLSYQDNDAVIISAVRTPIGKFQGSLSDLSAPRLGAIVVKEAVKRANLDLAKILKLAEIDQQARRGKPEGEHRHEALTAREQLGVAVVARQ